MALPAPTHELRSDRNITLSGSSVTAWGDASGGTSPTYSNAEDDRILGFPVVQFDASLGQHLLWPIIVAMFTGDDPEFTAALTIRPKLETGAKTALGIGNTSNRRDEVVRVTGTPSFLSNRQEDLVTFETVDAGSFSYGIPFLVMVKQGGTTRQIFARNLITDAEMSNESATFNLGNITMANAALGADFRSAPTDFYEGDMARAWLKNRALTGDLTGDLTGTELGDLKAEMLSTFSGDLLRDKRYGVGLGIGLGL